jgi:uridine kinase
MKALFSSPLFIVGLAVRVTLIILATPTPMKEWYVPFLNVSTEHFALDPWGVWLNHAGSSVAFPYGYAMWLTFVPLILLCKLFALPLAYGYGSTLLVADFALLHLLRRLVPGRDLALLATYWLSPIVILASYGLGFNDLVPVLFLALSLTFVRETRPTFAGLACMLAVSAKLSMVLALPFFFIYLLHSRVLKKFLPQLLKGIAFGAVFSIFPMLLSSGGLQMIFSNPELEKVFRLSFGVGGNNEVYIIPLVYFLMLYAAGRIRRLNFELFSAMLGLAFLLVVLMTPASPGWFIWVVPLLVTYQIRGDRVAIMLTTVFAALYVVTNILISQHAFATLPNSLLTGVFHWSSLSSGHAISLLHTIMVAAGASLALRILRDTVSRNDYFRLSQAPFVIGIAGDSGAGKDTFADAIKGLFGSHSVTMLSGDDYHLWDRQKPMWQVMTHLNPRANDLQQFADDLVALIDGKSIQSRHYDHQSGRRGHPGSIDSNDIIIASGLHTLYLPILRECYGLSVYLDMDERLRKHFKLQRDVGHRGHTTEKVLETLAKREPDSIRFIKSQAHHADLVLSLRPVDPRMLEELDEKRPLRLKLVARSSRGLNEMSLTRVLVGICGLHVDMVPSTDGIAGEITIEGETSAADIAQATQIICPRILEFLDTQPKWRDGVMGLMQLITLSHINQALTRRIYLNRTT